MKLFDRMVIVSLRFVVSDMVGIGPATPAIVNAKWTLDAEVLARLPMILIRHWG